VFDENIDTGSLLPRDYAELDNRGIRISMVRGRALENVFSERLM
jgi:hypothetical protein